MRSGSTWRCLPGCRANLLRRALRASQGGELSLVREGLAARPYIQAVLALPSRSIARLFRPFRCPPGAALAEQGRWDARGNRAAPDWRGARSRRYAACLSLADLCLTWAAAATGHAAYPGSTATGKTLVCLTSPSQHPEWTSSPSLSRKSMLRLTLTACWQAGCAQRSTAQSRRCMRQSRHHRKPAHMQGAPSK